MKIETTETSASQTSRSMKFYKDKNQGKNNTITDLNNKSSKLNQENKIDIQDGFLEN